MRIKNQSAKSGVTFTRKDPETSGKRLQAYGSKFAELAGKAKQEENQPNEKKGEQ